MHKIKRVSLIFRTLFQLAFLIWPILFIAFWLNAPKPLIIGNHRTGIIFSFLPNYIEILQPYILHSLNISTKLLGLIISLIPIGITELTLYFLIRLFHQYSQGEIFSLSNVNYLKNIGYTLLFGQLFNLIYEALITLTLTWHNPPGHRLSMISLSFINFGVVLIALLIILISWIMAEGYKLQEEHRYTI